MRLELITNIIQILRSRVLANISYLTSGSFLQIVFGFCSNILLVRFLDPEHFGTYAVIFAALSMISSIISLRIPIHIIKAKEISTSEQSELYFLTLLEICLFIAVGLLLIVFFDFNPTYFIVAILSLCFSIFFSFQKALVERIMKYKLLVGIETAAMFISHSLAIYFAYHNFGVLSLFLRDLMFAGLGTMLLFYFGYFVRPSLPKINTIPFKRYLQSVGFIYIDQSFEQLLTRFRIILIEFISGPTGTGIFFQAERLATVPHQLMQSIVGRFALNYFSRINEDNRKFVFLYILLACFFFGAIILFFASLYIDPLILFLYGPQWSDVSKVFMLLFGMVVFLPSIELIKSLAYAENNKWSLIILRGSQIGGMLLPLGLYIANSKINISSFSLCISISFIAGTFIPVLALMLGKRRHNIG
jgi:O-antigen/teichoic acid export membrane protein